MPRQLNMSEVNALTRNICRAVTALEDDDRETELLEMQRFISAAISSIRESKKAQAVHA